MFKKMNKCMGVGINYRREIAADILTHRDKVDFIEINTERFFVGEPNSAIKEIIDTIPVIFHGLTLSIGTSNQAMHKSYLENLAKTLGEIDCLWFSEHIAITNVDGFELRALAPVEFTPESVENIVAKAKQIQALTPKQFLLENIAYYYQMPTDVMTEVEFITQLVEKSDSGILLDLNNLHVNAINHKYDPYDFIDKLPLERVVEVHLAGCEYIHGMLIDTHASAIKKEVFSLFEYLCKKTLINGVVIERDDRLEKFSDLIDEVELVRDILIKNRMLQLKGDHPCII